MSFMEPQIIESEYWIHENKETGEETISFESDIGENTIARKQTGLLWRLSAPGYMDCTEWSSANSVEECVSDMLSMYGDGFDREDYNILANALEGFDEFWNGYLLALAFTGGEEKPNGNYDSDMLPLVSNPGGDIRDVIDSDEIEGWLSDEQYAELIDDCLYFFLSARELIGDDCDDAGSDFHLTRNGHGAGFWDGDWPEHGDKLTELSKPYGSCELVRYKGEYSIQN